jgi:hypothetical protein
MFRIVVFASMLLIGFVRLEAQSWDSVSRLQAGTQVWVQDSKGQDHRGRISSVSADAISIETGHGQEAIERVQVRRVEVRAPSHRLRNGLIGAGIGLAVGLLTDNTLGAYLRNESGESSGTRAVTYIAPIGVFGAIGAAFPAQRTIYKSK